MNNQVGAIFDLRAAADSALHFARNSLMLPETVIGAIHSGDGADVTPDLAAAANDDLRLLQMSLDRLQGLALLSSPCKKPVALSVPIREFIGRVVLARVQVNVCGSIPHVNVLADATLLVAAFSDYSCESARAMRSLPPGARRVFSLSFESTADDVLVSLAKCEGAETPQDTAGSHSCFVPLVTAGGAEDASCSGLGFRFRLSVASP